MRAARLPLSVACAATVLGIMAAWLSVSAAPAWAAKALSGSVSLNGGQQYTTSSSVAVTSQVRGAKLMRFKKADGSFSAWETYAVSKSWDLGGGDGTKVLEAQFKGSNGARVVLFDDIVLDATGPVTSSDYDGLPHRLLTITFTSADALSGVASTWYRLDGGNWREATSTTLRVHPKRSGTSAGPHTVDFYSTDVLGNVGETGTVVALLE
jgi:hypothetical protein